MLIPVEGKRTWQINRQKQLNEDIIVFLVFNIMDRLILEKS